MAVTIWWHKTGEQHDGHVFDADTGELLAQSRYTIARDPWLGWEVNYFSNPDSRGVLVGSGKTKRRQLARTWALSTFPGNPQHPNCVAGKGVACLLS